MPLSAGHGHSGVLLIISCVGLAYLQATQAGAPYRLLEEMADDLDVGGSFVEVGSDRSRNVILVDTSDIRSCVHFLSVNGDE